MPLNVLSASASVGVFSLTALLSGAFLVHEVLKVKEGVLPSILIAMYLGLGLPFIAFVSVVAGLFFISPLPPVAVSAALGLLVAYRERSALRRWNFRTIIEAGRRDLPGLLVLVLSFAYFAVISGLMKWPPPGDVATAHGPMVTLFLADGRIPLNEQGFAVLYPPGLQALAASLGPVALTYGGDMVFALGAALAALLAPLMYAITYTWTGQWRWATLAAFIPFVPHPFNNLEQWTVGYFFNGPYPNLFGFVILLTLVVILFIDQRPMLASSQWRRAAVVALVILECLFIYPSFAILATLLLGTWLLLQRSAIRRELVTLLGSKRARLWIPVTAAAVVVATIGYIALLDRVGQSPWVMVDYLVGRYMPGGGGAAGSPLPYAVPPLFFVDHVSGWVSLLAVVAVLYRIRRRVSDFLDWWYLIFGVALFVSLTGPGFDVLWPILPSRSSPLFALLGWPVVLRTLRDHPLIQARPTEGSAIRTSRIPISLPRGNLFPLLVAAVVIITPIAVQPSLIVAFVNPVANYGTFWGKPSFDQDFQVLQWIAEHANHSALMANDGSYMSRYLLSVTIQNTSNTNWFEARYPQRGWDLHLIWVQPRDITYLSEMIRKYDVRYIFATSEGGTVYPPVSFTYMSKMYPPKLADAIFDHYGFLTTDYSAGLNRVYEVRATPTLTTTAIIGNATSTGFWNLVTVSGSGSIGFPYVAANGSVIIPAGGFGGWNVEHRLPLLQDWTNATYLSVELRTSESVGLTITLFDAAGRSNSWDIVTLPGQVTRADLPLRFPDEGTNAIALGSIAALSLGNGTFGPQPRAGDGIAMGAVFLSG